MLILPARVFPFYPLLVKNGSFHTKTAERHTAIDPRYKEDYLRYTEDDPHHAAIDPRHTEDDPRHAAIDPRHTEDDPRHAAIDPRHTDDDSRHAATYPRHRISLTYLLQAVACLVHSFSVPRK